MATPKIDWTDEPESVRQTTGSLKLVRTESDVTIQVSLYPLGENHPLAHLFGKYDDEPLWEDFEAAIRENPNVIE